MNSEDRIEASTHFGVTSARRCSQECRKRKDCRSVYEYHILIFEMTLCIAIHCSDIEGSIPRHWVWHHDQSGKWKYQCVTMASFVPGSKKENKDTIFGDHNCLPGVERTWNTIVCDLCRGRLCVGRGCSHVPPEGGGEPCAGLDLHPSSCIHGNSETVIKILKQASKQA